MLLKHNPGASPLPYELSILSLNPTLPLFKAGYGEYIDSHPRRQACGWQTVPDGQHSKRKEKASWQKAQNSPSSELQR